ncbi:MAG: hypothetical protein ACYDBQ_11385 [Thermoplasmatota archaeon]
MRRLGLVGVLLGGSALALFVVYAAFGVRHPASGGIGEAIQSIAFFGGAYGALAGLIVAVVSRRRPPERKAALAGLVLNAVALALFLMGFMVGFAYSAGSR